MSSSSCLSPALILSLLFSTPAAIRAQESERSWDQEAAVERIEEVLRIEDEGRPWRNIEWLTDAEDAIALAQEEGKPIFVFVYLRKDGGPDDAPC
ncbi:MAG: hypothetical protein AAF196_01040 [Planctomycetota bacterium]